jgi:hypothetical protein
MLLELAFEAPGEHVQEAGALVYRVYENSGRYVLPDVVLRSGPGAQRVEVQQASVTSVTPSAGAFERLGSAIRELWNAAARGGGWVVGRRELVMGTELDAGLVAPVLDVAAGQPAELIVTWHYVYTDAGGVAAANDVRVRLQFMPHGAEPAGSPPGQPGESYADRHHLPGALRHRGSGQAYNGFAAVDFGTSSSAVAVHDTRRTVPRSIDTGQARVLRSELVGLLTARPPLPLIEAWEEQRGLLAEYVAAKLSNHGTKDNYGIKDVDSLLAQLTGVAAEQRAAETTDPVLDTVCRAVEQRVAECPLELARWLAPRLHACLDKAFKTPDLDEQQIQEVVFDADTKGREISSWFKITESNPIQIKLGEEDGAHDVSRRLKTEMFEGAPLPLPGMTGAEGRDATTEDLVAQVYCHLVTRTEEFLRTDKDVPVQPLIDLVVSYPTTTLPSGRQRLKDMLTYCLGLAQVTTDFDEGVAAGLFFLMRDFGTQRVEFGAEALRARSRLISSDPPTWQQNMLIIDIGAGTTDIALIGLTLQDITKDIPGLSAEDALVRGRHYLIRPEVLNSTGHPQLGGNYLTLRVFYWLKATLLDALATGPDSSDRKVLAGRIRTSLGPDAPGKLASMVVEGGADEPAPREVAEALRANLPTHRENAQDPPGDAFTRLWRLAEKAKIAFGTSPRPDTSRSGEEPEADPAADYAISHSDLQPVLRAIDELKVPGLPELFPLLPKADLLLRRDAFETLARPVLRQAAELAAWLVRTTFDGRQEARLDRVVLSGKTSRMPLLSDVVTEVLTADGETGRRLPWNPATLDVETERAKQAAALGACWAQSFRMREAGGDEAELARNRTLLTFDVENLFRSLPCGFSQQLVATQGKPLLRAGTKMIEVDGTGTLAARAGWERLVPMFEVHRPNGQRETIQWGVFRYYTRHDLDGFRPSPEIWGPSADGARGSRIMAQLEVDQGLNPYLYLCQGEPHYFVGVPGDLALDLRSEFDRQDWDTGERRLRKLPAAVMVLPTNDDGSVGKEEELFPGWEPEQDAPTAAYFPVFFHAEDSVPGTATPGRISAPLPPSADGYYEISLHWPGGKKLSLGRTRVTGSRGAAARYVATLDVQGTLRLHRGDPPYWAARSLRDVENHPGSVHRVQMDPGLSELKPSWKPFDGMH